MLGRALELERRIGQDGIATRADLARELGVSRARVTQLLSVLGVPGPLMNTLRRAEALGRPVTEPVWRKIKALPAEEATQWLHEWGYG